MNRFCRITESRGILLFLGLIAWSSIAPPIAAAYLDPLSGSIVVQVIAATVLGAMVGFRRSWDAICRVARRLVGRPSP